MSGYVHGWYQLAFERDLTEAITPLNLGGRALMAVRGPEGPVRVFDAVCPHRGAHLGHGGRFAGDAVVCPFHGYRIGLGQDSSDGFCAREYVSLVGGGGLFVRLSERAEPDFPKALATLGAGHTFVQGFEMTADTSIEVVIENGFDNAHFRVVHGLIRPPGLAMCAGSFGELAAEGSFEIPSSGWQEGPGAPRSVLKSRYVAHAFSPGVFIAELAGDPPFRYRIMTTATPSASGTSCTIRLTLMLQTPAGGGAPNERFVSELLQYSRDGLEMDRAIWNRLDLRHVPRFTKQDAPALAFGEFCRGFRDGN